MKVFTEIQKIGKALMTPVAILPAAALAMYHEAKAVNKKIVGGILLCL